MEQPSRNGSDLEALIVMRMHKGAVLESAAISCMTEGEKLAKEGTKEVNSADRRNPKYTSVHATQNIQ